MRFDNVVEAVWLYAKEHANTYISRRVALDLLRPGLYKGFDGAGSAAVRRANADHLLDWLASRGLLIMAALKPPAGGARERRFSFLDEGLHYYVADQAVWEALMTAARLGDLEGMPT